MASGRHGGVTGMSDIRSPRRFQLILIKPSHYDDDGYVIQWFRSVMPSNSLAALYGLSIDAAERQVLGANVAIDVTPIDETNTRIRPEKIIAQLKRHGGFGLVGLVGVQSNQFPRAMDIARPLRAAGVNVVIGGFHISGCLSMLKGIQPDIQEALDLGISLFAGEAEEQLDSLLRDAAAGKLQPVYNYLNDLPSIQSTPVPMLLRKHVSRTVGNYSTFDAGRGCPYQCSFCTIINVQGGNHDAVRPTISSGSFGRTGKKVFIASSSPMTISPVIKIGRSSSIASSSCASMRGSLST